jgi:hypothetical protein
MRTQERKHPPADSTEFPKLEFHSLQSTTFLKVPTSAKIYSKIRSLPLHECGRQPVQIQYVSKMNHWIGPIASTSGTPGAYCYRCTVSASQSFLVCLCDFSFPTNPLFFHIFQTNPGIMAGSMGAIYKSTILTLAAMYFMH